MSKHTPGPWKVDFENRPSIYVHATDDGEAVDIAKTYNRHEEDACLIAAAPDLLDALMIACCPICKAPTCAELCGSVEHREMQAAISKATGGKR